MSANNSYYRKLVDSVEEKTLAGGCMLREEAEELLNTPDEYILRDSLIDRSALLAMIINNCGAE